MSQTMLANIAFFLGAAGVFVAEHFGIIDANGRNTLLGFIGGGAAFAGTLQVAKGAPVIQPKPAQAPVAAQPTSAAPDPITQAVSTGGQNLTPVSA